MEYGGISKHNGQLWSILNVYVMYTTLKRNKCTEISDFTLLTFIRFLWKDMMFHAHDNWYVSCSGCNRHIFYIVRILISDYCITPHAKEKACNHQQLNEISGNSDVKSLWNCKLEMLYTRKDIRSYSWNVVVCQPEIRFTTILILLIACFKIF